MTSTRRFPSLIVLVAAVVLVLAACAGDDSSESEATAAFDTAEADTTEAAADGGGSRARGDADQAPTGEIQDESPARGEGDRPNSRPAVQAQDLGRSIIFTADMTVAVDDVVEAGVAATDIVEDLGGFLFGQETVGLPEPHSTLTFKIEPAAFDEALVALGGIGDVGNQTVSADDVTEKVVDLQSRIATAETSVERLRSLIADAPGVQAIVQLEQQLLDRESELESMRAQLRTLEDRVALATIVVTLTQSSGRPLLELAVSAYPGHADAGQSCPGDPGIAVDEGDEVTVCFELTNAGDMPLAGFDVADSVLELDMDDLIVVFGDPEATLEPGQSIVLAAETTSDRTLRTQTRATAVPIDADDELLENRQVSTTESIQIESVDPGGLPGFGDALAASVDALVQIVGVAVLLAGALLPFLWVPVLIWLMAGWWQRRRRDDAAGWPGESDAVDEPTGTNAP